MDANQDYDVLLNKRYVVGILMLIHDNKRAMATDLLRVGKNYNSVISAAGDLEEAGLIVKHLEEGKRLMKIFELTPKGEKVARLLIASDKIISGELDFGDDSVIEFLKNQ